MTSGNVCFILKDETGDIPNGLDRIDIPASVSERFPFKGVDHICDTGCTAVLPLSSYVAILAQGVCKLAQ